MCNTNVLVTGKSMMSVRKEGENWSFSRKYDYIFAVSLFSSLWGKLILLFYLLQGGNPLDFKFGVATSLSFQSTSLTDQQAEHFLNRYIPFCYSFLLYVVD